MLTGFTSSYLPHKYLAETWAKLPSDADRTTRGLFFERLIAHTLLEVGIEPFFTQVSVALIDHIRYDVVLFERNHRPTLLTIKTSAGNRLAMAELESLALKRVYRRARCYLLVMSDEQEKIREKIQNGELSGIDDVYCVANPDFDDLLDILRTKEFVTPGVLRPTKGGRRMSNKKLMGF